MAKTTLHPYEQQMIDQILDAYQKGEQRIDLHGPMGAGKTTVAHAVAERLADPDKGQRLWIGVFSARAQRPNLRLIGTVPNISTITAFEKGIPPNLSSYEFDIVIVDDYDRFSEDEQALIRDRNRGERPFLVTFSTTPVPGSVRLARATGG